MGQANDEPWARLLADLPGGVVAIDAGGVVRFANQLARDLLGARGEVGANLGLPVTSGGFLELRTGPARTVEVRTATSALFGEEVTLVLLHDVTDFETSRSRLQDNMDAFELALGIAAHELRNPLAVLLAALDTLVDRGDELDVRAMASLHPRMRWHANRMRVLVDNTLAVTSGRGHLQAVPEEVDVAAAVQTHLRHAANPDAFVVTSDPELPLAYVTPRHLEQILLNLIGNAEKYGSAPFEITIAPVDGGIGLTVRDYGVGVPEGLREQVFHRYVRADADGRAAGTGLGLWVCRELARRNGGDVTYQPVDPGAAFLVTLATEPVDTDDAEPTTEETP